MTSLAKAYLAELTSGANPTEDPKTRVDVQFNPTSLRMQISNRTAGGQQAGAQARQRPGTGEVQVSFDLVFDTADEGSTDIGVSVLDKTKAVERFVRPRGNRSGQEAPPGVVFVWGGFHMQGTMESVNVDLDFFDAQGVPLRAKVSVTIKGQDPRLTYPAAPAGNANGSAANRPGGGSGTTARPGAGNTQPPGAPGTQGAGQAPERIVQAMPGESLAQLAARSGFAPSAWRALSDGLGNPLKLALGQEVALPPGNGQGSASGAAAQGSDPGRSTAALPLLKASPAGRSADDPVRQGQALAQRGGLGGAIGQQQQADHQRGAGASLAAFALAGATTANATADASDRPWGQGVPLRPRVGSGQAGKRPAGASRTQAASAFSRGAGLASAAPLAAPRYQRRCGCGCGGRGGCGGR